MTNSPYAASNRLPSSGLSTNTFISHPSPKVLMNLLARSTLWDASFGCLTSTISLFGVYRLLLMGHSSFAWASSMYTKAKLLSWLNCSPAWEKSRYIAGTIYLAGGQEMLPATMTSGLSICCVSRRDWARVVPSFSRCIKLTSGAFDPTSKSPLRARLYLTYNEMPWSLAAQRYACRAFGETLNSLNTSSWICSATSIQSVFEPLRSASSNLFCTLWLRRNSFSLLSMAMTTASSQGRDSSHMMFLPPDAASLADFLLGSLSSWWLVLFVPFLIVCHLCVILNARVDWDFIDMV